MKPTKKPSENEKMKKSIRNVFWLYCGLFAAVVLYLGYFMFFSSKEIISDAHNPRLSVLDNEIKRGTIYDCDGVILAYSELEGESYIRKYPEDKNLCHVLGYVDKGKSGVEARYNFDLQKLNKEIWQRMKQLALGTELMGNSLTLTVDMDIQNAAIDSLGRRKGAVVVMEPETGKILAMQSYPNFNPNNIAENWESLDADEASPFLNRASQGLYPPGSVFKIITAAALMENNENYKDIRYTCTGEAAFEDKIIHCFDSTAHGEVDIFSAMAYSCNTFFATQGYKMGAELLIEAAEERYFNKALSYPMEYNKSIFQLPYAATASEIVETAIGQGKTMLSPLHMAMLTSAVANGGIMMEPYLVDASTSYSGGLVQKNMPKLTGAVFSEEVAAELTEMMRQVADYGTGRAAGVENALVAGKTGTAENPNGTSHSWFTGFGERNGKKVVVTVVLENPEGNQSAAPIAGTILKAALDAVNSQQEAVMPGTNT